MTLYRCTVQYQRTAVTDRTFTVNFDFSSGTGFNFHNTGLDMCEAVAGLSTNITKVIGYEWNDIIVRSAMRFSNKLKAMAKYYYASSGPKRWQYQLVEPFTGAISTNGDPMPLGCGIMFATTDNGTGKEGKFMLRAGLTEGLVAATNLSNWAVHSLFTDKLELLVAAGSYFGKYFASAPSLTKMINCHVNKTGILTTNPIISIMAKRCSKYRSAQPGIS